MRALVVHEPTGPEALRLEDADSRPRPTASA